MCLPVRLLCVASTLIIDAWYQYNVQHFLSYRTCIHLSQNVSSTVSNALISGHSCPIFLKTISPQAVHLLDPPLPCEQFRCPQQHVVLKGGADPLFPPATPFLVPHVSIPLTNNTCMVYAALLSGLSCARCSRRLCPLFQQHTCWNPHLPCEQFRFPQLSCVGR